MAFGRVGKILSIQNVSERVKNRLIDLSSLQDAFIRANVFSLTRIPDTIVIEIPSRNPTPVQGSHVGPLWFIKVRAEIPEIKTMPSTRKGINLFEGQVLHDVVRVIQMLGSLRWSLS